MFRIIFVYFACSFVVVVAAFFSTFTLKGVKHILRKNDIILAFHLLAGYIFDEWIYRINVI